MNDRPLTPPSLERRGRTPLWVHYQPDRALSLWQPWAQLVVLGLKVWETRSWSTSYRGYFIVHAAARSPAPLDESTEPLYAALEAVGFGMHELPRGAHVGIAKLLDVYSTNDLIIGPDAFNVAAGDFSPDRFAYPLQFPRRFPLAREARGRQRFFIPTREDFSAASHLLHSTTRTSPHG